MAGSIVSEANRQEVSGRILEILHTLTADQDVELTLNTQLCDLGIDSVCVAYLIGDVQQHYALGDALYTALVTAGKPIMTLRISHLVDHICQARSESIMRGGERDAAT